MRSVLVLNHFAVPRGRPGGSRHIEMFSRLQGWRFLIVVSNRNYLTGQVLDAQPGFHPVRTIAYTNNGLRRILNWASYAVGAFMVGVRQRHVSLVYGSSPHLLAALAAWMIASVRRVPFVLEVRDLWPRVLVDMGQMSQASIVYRMLESLEMFAYRRANRIVVMAPGVRKDLVERGVPDARIAYIPNAADPEDFKPSAPKDTLRTKYGFDKLTAIYAGAHGPANGLELLLDAAAEVTCQPLDIVLVGGGVSKPKLQESAQRRGLTNVRFLAPVPKNEIVDMLHAADVGLHVLADVELFREGISPNKLFDYMAAGLPVLTNCPGVVSNIVAASACGWAVPPRELAAGLRELVPSSNSEERRRMGENGRRWIAQNQSRTAMVDRLAAVFALLVTERHAN